MKTLALWCALVGLPAAIAFAGPGEAGGTGGGKGVVCRATSGAIQSVESLDLWEAQNIYGRVPQASSKNLGTALSYGLDRLSYAIEANSQGIRNGKPIPGAEIVREELQQTVDLLRNTKLSYVHHLHGVKLQLTNDSYETITPASCGIEQIIRFSEYSAGGPEIFIDQDLFDRMDAVNQAALLLHEALYSDLRLGGEPSSVRVRRAIGIAFSGNSFDPPTAGLPAQIYQCLGYDNGRSEVLVYLDLKGYGVDLEVMRFQGRATVELGPRMELMGETIESFFTSSYPAKVDWGGRIGPDYAFEISVAPHPYDSSLKLNLRLVAAPDGSAPTAITTLDCQPKLKSERFPGY